MTPVIAPEVSSPFVSVRGIFYRAVLADSWRDALRGSASAGRYSMPDQPTLYMSASKAGVTAAMQAHPPPAGTVRTMCAMEVAAHKIFDLRDEQTCQQAAIRCDDALAPWQELVTTGRIPRRSPVCG
jgi:hypothetical protein